MRSLQSKCWRVGFWQRRSALVDKGRRALVQLPTPPSSTPHRTFSRSNIHQPRSSNNTLTSQPTTAVPVLVFTTMDTTVEPATPGEQTSLLPAASEADIIIKCGGETFSAYRATVRLQSQKLQDACDAAGKVSVSQDSGSTLP